MSTLGCEATSAASATERIGFVGLGRMGGPMARRLAEAGWQVTGFDSDERARARLVEESGAAAVDDVAALSSSDVLVLMLPDSRAVQAVLVDAGVLAALASGALVVDMGSSDPRATRTLAERAAELGVDLLDAPVSGGVAGAVAGTLTIMAGGEEGAFSRAEPMLRALGGRVLHVGGSGAGHAVKAINNLLSATHLLSSCEALVAARRFGLDVPAVLDAVNTSSGRSGSTENKWPNFIVPGSFDSGFALGLMVKDMRIALDLIRETDAESGLSAASIGAWEQALGQLGGDADHTEIARWVEAGGRP